MKVQLCLAALVAAGMLHFCGCRRQERDATALPDSDVAEVHLFEKGKGLRLPDEMQRALGVEIVELAEKRIERRVEKPAYVYRASEDSQTAAALAWLSEADAREVKAGQSVALKLPSAGTFSGTVVRVERQLTNLLGQSEAIIEFSDTQRRVVAGSLLMVIFASTNTNAVTAIPASAIMRGVEGAFVYTVGGSHYVRTPVKLGVESDGWAEVTDGLYSGDSVVARAVDALWNIELCALKGGTPCCPVGRKSGRDED